MERAAKLPTGKSKRVAGTQGSTFKNLSYFSGQPPCWLMLASISPIKRYDVKAHASWIRAVAESKGALFSLTRGFKPIRSQSRLHLHRITSTPMSRPRPNPIPMA
jgi:hypothetical protein